MSEKFQEPSKDAWEEVGQILNVECSSVDDIRLDLEKSDKGGVKQTIENCMTVFYRDPLLKGAIRKNELTCRLDLKMKTGWKRSISSSLTEVDEYQIQRYMESNYGLRSEKTADMSERRRRSWMRVEISEMATTSLKRAKSMSVIFSQ